jgi:ClpP class serine protease
MIQELTSLLNYRVWAFEKGFADRAVPVILGQLTRGLVSLSTIKQEMHEKIAARYRGMQSSQIGQYVSVRAVKTKDGKQVAIIPVLGGLTKRGDLCSYGMRDYINDENEDVVAIVLDMESPGGTVDGTNEFGLAVKQSKKPVVVFGDGMVASAAYWVASQARHIVANKNNPTEFGSIGTLYVHEYWGKFIEENIGSVEIIRAPQSVDKARTNPIEQLEDEQRAEILADLKEITNDFIKTVKKGRGDRLQADAEGLFTGKMFKRESALKIGMIDSVGNMMDAVNIAANLASGNSKSGSNKSKNMSIKKTVSSFFKGKKAATKAAEAEPTAAEGDNTPYWTEEMIFNTDGTGDGAFCLHPDTDGNDRKFETKIDNNQGNEPPTDPSVTEDDNWAVVADEAAEEEGAAVEPGAEASLNTVAKLNKALSFEREKAAKLVAEVSKLKKANASLKAKLDKAPAAGGTTVVSNQDKGHEYGKKQPVQSWEKKAAAKVGHKSEQ